MTDALRHLADAIRQLQATLDGVPVRGLGADDLLTRAEVRSALRRSWAEADRLLQRVPSVQVGRRPLYRWRRVLAVVEAGESPRQTIADLPRVKL